MTTKSSKVQSKVQTPPSAALPWWAVPKVQKIGMGILAVAVLLAAAWWFIFHPYVSTDDARVAVTAVRLAAEGMGGRVTNINVKEGDAVTQGEVLLELDHRTAQAELQRASARADLTLRKLMRDEEIAAKHGISAQELDSVKSAAQEAQADLVLAQVALDNTFIKSPVDGVVVQKSSEVGNIIEPGQTALTIDDIDGAWVSANIEETSIGRVRAGQPVSIDIDEGGTVKGHVSEINSAAASQFALIPPDNVAGNFTKLVQLIPIKITLDPHPGLALRAGESVEIRIRVL